MILDYMLDHSPVVLGVASIAVAVAVVLLWLFGRRGGPRPRR